MKKALWITLAVVGVLIGSLFLIPVIFKDEIKAKIDEQLSKTVNAEVQYAADGVSISLFRNFPNLTVTLEDIAIIGKVDQFKGDTLYKAKETRLVTDLMSVISGDKIIVRAVKLQDPHIVTKMSKDGIDSWSSLMIPSEEDPAAPEEEASEFQIGIENWEIINGTIIYDDASLPMYAELRQVSHTGKGDLTQEQFIMETYTSSPSAFVVYDGITYLSGNILNADVKLDMNYQKMEFRFLENEFKVNDFIMGMDGLIAMPNETDIVMDLTYKAKETDFKNLVSLIPAVFTKDYDKLETKGKIAFDGYVKGTMNDSLMPGFGLNLNVNDGYFHYPDLPAAVENIAVDLAVDNKDGITENMVVNLKKFHMDMAGNPVDANALIEGIGTSNINAKVLAKVNLADLTKVYPIEGIQLKGLYSLNLTAKGIYSETSMPIVNAAMSMKNGYVKSSEVPEPLEDLSFNATVLNEDGTLGGTKINLENFNMKFQNEPFFMKAYVENLDDPKYDVTLKGILDLTKLTKLYPLDDMTVSGRINADVATKGVMSDIDAGNYMNTSTAGQMDVTNLVYSSPDFPQGMKLSTASFSFIPEKASINSMKGSVGKSDIDIQGYVSNYMAYMFGKGGDTTVKGKMTFRSKKFDVNEWMTEEETTETSAVAEETGVFEVPRDIDFVLSSSIDQVLYSNMDMKNMTGNVIVKDGIVRLDQLAFNSMGGKIVTNGTYNTQDISTPKFDMDLKIDQVQIKEAYNTFSTIQAFAPAAQNMEGTFSSVLSMAGILGQDMMPDMNTLGGKGVATIISATMKGSKVMQGISTLTNVPELDPMQLKNVLVQFEIHDGKIFVKPFDVKAGKVKMNVEGNQSVTGDLDYLVKMDIPAGAVGSAVNTKLASLTGKPADNNQNVKLDLKVGGTFSDPKISPQGSSVKEQATDAVKDAVKDRAKEEIKNNPDIQQTKQQVEQVKDQAKDQVQDQVDKTTDEAKDKATDAVQDGVKDGIKDVKKKLPFGK